MREISYRHRQHLLDRFGGEHSAARATHLAGSMPRDATSATQPISVGTPSRSRSNAPEQNVESDALIVRSVSATPKFLRLFWHSTPRAASRALEIAGSSNADKMPMIEITTSISTSVKPFSSCCYCFVNLP